MRVMAFVQARMGSTRLPGKSLMPVWNGMGVLEMTLRRALRARTLSGVVLCTSTDPACDALETLASGLGVQAFRGPEDDVLTRYALATERFEPDAVVRICADSPLVCPEGIDALVAFFRDEGLDYAAHAMDGTGLPDGLGCEVFTAAALAQAHAEATAPEDREHVSLFIRHRPERFRQATLAADAALRAPGVSLDVDTQDDLDALRRFIMALPPSEGPFWSADAIAPLARGLHTPPQGTSMDIASDDYHDFFIRDGKLIGEFEQMYRKSRHAPWHQDEACDKWFNKVSAALVGHALDDPSVRTVFEVGSGLGYFLSQFAGEGRTLTGTDVSATAVEKARALFPGISFEVDDIRFEGRRGPYDLCLMQAVCWCIFPHMDDVVRNVTATVRPGGYLFLGECFQPLDGPFAGKDIIPTPDALIGHFSHAFDTVADVRVTRGEMGGGPIIYWLGRRRG